MSQEQSEPEEVRIDRVLTLSDGVFAVALTLLVLDLPTVSHGLFRAVVSQRSEYLS